MPRRVRVRPRRPAAAAALPSGTCEDDDALEPEAPLELLERIGADADADLLGAARLQDLRDDAADRPDRHREADARRRAATC